MNNKKMSSEAGTPRAHNKTNIIRYCNTINLILVVNAIIFLIAAFVGMTHKYPKSYWLPVLVITIINVILCKGAE